MSEDVVVSPDAQGRQRRASDPTRSVWVSANAGAGKTKVLTDRVIRLMLAGSAASRILCLTFTKAAAAEMTIRVFHTLGDWVTLDDPALTRALEGLTGQRPGPADRARARRLFARAVETPGGLKIETIHAFCERLLHLVPFEAEVPPRFAVLDDGEAAELMAEARAGVLKDAASGEARFAALAQALDVVASEISGDGLTRLVATAVADARIPGDADAIAAAAERLAAAMGLAPDETPDDVRRVATEGGIPSSEWPAVAAALAATGKPTDLARAGALALAARSPSLGARADHYGTVFFTESDTPRASVATAAAPADLRARLAAERDRLVALRPRLLAADAVWRSRALFTLAAAIRERFVGLKQRAAALDFGDLIAKTLDLLERGNAPWVLYRLDRGIDHVLVDEAQDTNPEQWRILRRLTEEFTAGEGRPVAAPRTVFAVGDPKQSIYSFQGADPRLFEESRRHWTDRHRAAGLGFETVRLDLSFRSAATILRTVDHTFRVAAHFQGLSFDDTVTGTTHESARPKAAGHVEIWPTERPSGAAPDPEAWSLPVDAPDRNLPAIVAAGRVAQAVRAWTSTPDPATGRIWRPGEILILARKRGPAFFAVIRGLKAAGVPVAGADRIDINEQIAVNDLVAAGQAALLPGNDLALASVLKSPLVGLDDDDLVRIAVDRPPGTSLIAALEGAAATDGRAREAFETVSAWRRLARQSGPFGFYAALLGPGGGRRRLVERLGGEAADAIDVFLCRAAAEESGPAAPSLTGFIARFERAEHVIKRDPEAAGDEVRVMTVHGAKGLEAPLVVVLDGCDVWGEDPKLIAVPTGGNGDPVPVWTPGRTSDPPLVAEARIALRDRGLEEHNRLLYVALTRARDRLVLVPFTNGTGREPPEAWSAMVRRGFEEATHALVRTEMPYGPVDLWQEGSGRSAAGTRQSRGTIATPVPDWLGRAAAPEPEALPPLRPSGPLGAADRPDPRRPTPSGRAAARRHGILVHGLVDRLAAAPGPDRRALAAPWLAARAGSLAGPDRDRVIADAFGVLDHPALSSLFGPEGRGEVAISGEIGPPGRTRRVSGQIDRLLVGPDGVAVADLKTGSPPPDGSVPPPYLAQLALYRALLAGLHPGRPVRALLVWTEGPTVVEPGPAELDRALAAALAALP